MELFVVKSYHKQVKELEQVVKHTYTFNVQCVLARNPPYTTVVNTPTLSVENILNRVDVMQNFPKGFNISLMSLHVTTCAVERSFSKYKNVPADSRRYLCKDFQTGVILQSKS